MLENQRGSPDATELSRLGSDFLVMNLRPTEKEKHMDSKPTIRRFQTRAE